jgi:hypothetical protein
MFHFFQLAMIGESTIVAYPEIIYFMKQPAVGTFYGELFFDDESKNHIAT